MTINNETAAILATLVLAALGILILLWGNLP